VPPIKLDEGTSCGEALMRLGKLLSTGEAVDSVTEVTPVPAEPEKPASEIENPEPVVPAPADR